MKKIWLVILSILVITVIAYNYIYQDHRDIENEAAEFSLTANNITNEFLVNPEKSEKKYLNKVIEVSGIITEQNHEHITLNDKVFCQFNNLKSIPELNSIIKIKGRLIGYDNLFEQIKLDQCSIIN